MHIKSTTSALLTVAAVTLIVASCGSSTSTTAPATSSATSTQAEQFPVTVTTADGPVTIKVKPTRIVSLSPTSTEDLYAVGAGPQVVAVDADSNYPANAPVTKLSGLTPNIEAIARYQPSLVIAYQDVHGMVASLAKLGIPTLIEPAANTLDDAYNEITQIGAATGNAAQAEQTVSGMKQQIVATIAQTPKTDLSYFWELQANPYFSVTSKTFLGQIVGLFGLKNVADAADKASDGGYPELSQEYIITSKPQLIFLADNYPSDGGQSPSMVAKRPGWDTIPAVKNNGIIPLNDDIASRWGPRLPQLVAEIAQAIAKVSG